MLAATMWIEKFMHGWHQRLVQMNEQLQLHGANTKCVDRRHVDAYVDEI